VAISDDIFVWFFAFVFLYYTFLFFVSKRPAGHRVATYDNWGFVILIPGHNEAMVIEDTVRRAMALTANIHIVVIDDGSDDGTGDIAERIGNERVHVLRRVLPNAVKGKGEALNHAYHFVGAQYREWFPRISDSNIVITVLDADGYLDPHLFDYIAGMLERNPRLGGIQTPVTIRSPESSLWLRMQDLEFVGFSGFVQQARHWFSSIGLGGNGQFIRATALQKLGTKPWSPALSEDLDIGIRLLLQGERLGFCNLGFVHQQGLTKLRPLLKQRTRWVQGHYQAWKYIPQIWKSRTLGLFTKLDLTLYLTLVSSVFIVLLNLGITFAASAGFLSVGSSLMGTLYNFSPYVARLSEILLSIGPALLFAATYNKLSRSKIPFTSWPAIIVIFCAYGWIWVYASIKALTRLAKKQNNWVKTERIQMTDTVTTIQPSNAITRVQ